MWFTAELKELHKDDNWCARCTVWYPRTCADCALKHTFGLMPHPQHPDPSDRANVSPEAWSALAQFLEEYPSEPSAEA